MGVVVGSSDVIRAKLLWPLWTRVSGAWKADEPMSIAWTSPGSIDVSGERNLERGGRRRLHIVAICILQGSTGVDTAASDIARDN